MDRMGWFRSLLLLTCMLVPVTASADNATTEASYGGWKVFRATDPMNDQSWYGATLQSTADDATLQVDCVHYLPNRLRVEFRFKEYIGGTFPELTYRMDKNPAHHVVASASEYHASLLCEPQCTGTGKGPEPDTAFVAEARKASSLLVRINDFRYRNVEVSFNLDHAGDAFDHLLRGCAELAAQSKKKPKPQH